MNQISVCPRRISYALSRDRGLERSSSIRSSLAPILLSALLLMSSSGIAQTADDSDSFVLEEIIITALKREQTLQDAAVSVVAIGGERMRQAGITKAQDLSAYMPSLQVNEATGTDSMFIRGIGSGINMGFEQSVGTVIDGVYYGRSRFSRAQFLDLERVEVVKGPQGILFGKNTTSGVINITTANPADGSEGWLTAAHEFEDGETSLEGALSGRLNDQLGARIAFRYNELEGYLSNISTGNDDPRTDDWTSRLSVLWEPTGNLSVSAKYQYGESDKQGRNTELTRCGTDVKNALQALGSRENCRFDTKRANVSARNSGDPDFGEQEGADFNLFSLSVNWVVGSHTITSVTGYSEYDYDDKFTADHVPLSVTDADIGEHYRQLSQEVRLTSPGGERFEYMVGIFYQETALAVEWNLFTDFPTFFGSGPAFSRLSKSHQDSDTLALFGQGIWNLTDVVALTLGARYSEEEKSGRSRFDLFDDELFTTTPAGAAVNIHDVNESRRESNFSPMVSVKWQPSNDLMGYMTISKGFKGGGYDYLNPFPQTAAASFEYDKEEVLAYELGAKMKLLEGAGELNITLFRSEFDDLQVSALAPSGIINFFVANAAEAVSQGLEVEGRWQVTENLFTAATIAYLDSEFDSFPGASCYALQTFDQGCKTNGNGQFAQDLSGKDTQFAPSVAANLHAQYVWPVGHDNSLEAVLALDIHYSRDYMLATDLDPNLRQKSYEKVDIRVALRSDGGGWELALVGKNLNDRKTTVWGNDAGAGPEFAGTYYKHLDRGRTLALQASLRF